MNDANNMNAIIWNEIWNETLRLLENDVNKPTFDTWFKSTELAAYYGENIIIKVQNDFAKNYLKNNYTHIIKNHLESMLNHSVKLQFVTPQEKENAISQLLQQQDYTQEYAPSYPEERAYEADKPYRAPEPVSYVEEQPRLFTRDTGLNTKYTFDSFVVGGSNRMTHAACMGVADNIANNSSTRVYNPLFIHGGSGLGKTHLMHAIGNHILMHKPNARISYLSSETFTNEIIDAIMKNKRKEFRDKYRTVDVLLIDDIQFIADKESTQEEFFHTFNALREAEKQIIISSDRPPNEIPKLEERLRTRFNQGLLTDIQPPDLETRIAILRKKAELNNYEVSDEILQYIADRIKSNVRELEGALNKLLAYNNLVNTSITMEIAEKELSNIITPDKPREITPQLIIEVVSEHFHISVDQMISKNRSSEIAKPRQIAMYLCRTMTDVPLETIGSYMGKRDHSTIKYGADKISKDISKNESLKNTIEVIMKKINPS